MNFAFILCILGAKLDSIIRHIKYIIHSCNGKSVVFSQWKDVLNLLADGLKKNGINFVRVDNTVRDDRIKQFSEDPNIHVILLHSRSQSRFVLIKQKLHAYIHN